MSRCRLRRTHLFKCLYSSIVWRTIASVRYCWSDEIICFSMDSRALPTTANIAPEAWKRFRYVFVCRSTFAFHSITFHHNVLVVECEYETWHNIVCILLIVRELAWNCCTKLWWLFWFCFHWHIKMRRKNRFSEDIYLQLKIVYAGQPKQLWVDILKLIIVRPTNFVQNYKLKINRKQFRSIQREQSLLDASTSICARRIENCLFWRIDRFEAGMRHSFVAYFLHDINHTFHSSLCAALSASDSQAIVCVCAS